MLKDSIATLKKSITFWFLLNTSINLANKATTKPIPAAFKAIPTPFTALPIPLNPFAPFCVASSSFLVLAVALSIPSVTSPMFDFTSNSTISFAILKCYICS